MCLERTTEGWVGVDGTDSGGTCCEAFCKHGNVFLSMQNSARLAERRACIGGAVGDRSRTYTLLGYSDRRVWVRGPG